MTTMTDHAEPGHNSDQRARFRDRAIAIEQEIKDAASARADLAAEMKGAGLDKATIRGIRLAVRRSFESSEAKEARETAEQVADALGAFADSALGAAAVRGARG